MESIKSVHLVTFNICVLPLFPIGCTTAASQRDGCGFNVYTKYRIILDPKCGVKLRRTQACQNNRFKPFAIGAKKPFPHFTLNSIYLLDYFFTCSLKFKRACLNLFDCRPRGGDGRAQIILVHDWDTFNELIHLLLVKISGFGLQEGCKTLVF